MKRLCALLIAAALCFPSIGALGWWQSIQQVGINTGPCSQATTFLARTSGLSGTESTAYTAMICGMVTDGTWSLLDALYIFATNTTTTANLNLISTSFGLTKTGTVTFTADQGYTGNGTTGFLDTGFVPSIAGGNFQRNSASIGAYVLNNRLSGANYAEFGTDGTGNNTFDTAFLPWYTDNNSYWDVNGNAATAAAAVTVRGSWIITRTGSTARARYLNGAANTSSSASSTGLATLSVLILAEREGTSGAASAFSADQLSAAFVGGGLTATQAGQIAARINAYMTALGINVY